MPKNFGYALITAAAMAAGALMVPALAAGPGGGGGGGGGTGGGGGGGSVPTVVNYKITGNILFTPALCSPTPQLGYAEFCAAFPTGTPFTLTFTVTTSTSAGLQNDGNFWCGTSSTDPSATIKTTRSVAVFSKAVSNINLQLANGISYVAPGQSGDISLENDTCLAGGVAAWDRYSLDAKSLTGPNSFPSYSNGTATVSLFMTLNDMANVSDPNSPLPPTALTSLSLPAAAPEAHALQYNSAAVGIGFRFPLAGQVTVAVGLPISTWEVVP